MLTEQESSAVLHFVGLFDFEAVVSVNPMKFSFLGHFITQFRG